MCPDSTLSPSGTATCTVSSALSGTYTVTATYSGDSNYTGIAGSDDTAYVGPAPLVITASDASMTYGASAPAITATYNGFENGDDPTSLTIQPSCSTAATSSSPVGNYTSSCSGAYDPNYTISYVQGSVAVGPAPLTVTASNGQMTYGGGAPAISPSFSGFKNGDDTSSLTTQPTCSTSASSSSQVGSYSSSCAGAYDPNYDISYKDGSVSVGKAPLKITASGGSMTYGGSPPTIGVATYAGFVNGDGPSSLSTKPTCSTDATSSSSVSGSPYPSSCSGTSATDYSITYADGSVTVNPAPLKITASDGTMTYGGSPPAITVSSYTGFVNGDDAASLSVQATCSTNATATSPVGSYSSSCTGAYDPDYTISYGYGSVSVGQADLTVTASDASMTYGGTVPTISPEYSGFKNGDSAVNLSTQPSCSTDANRLEPCRQLQLLLLGSIGGELRHQLCERHGQGHSGALDDHRLQRVDELRRQSTEDHRRQLRGFRQRGYLDQPGHSGDLLDHGEQLELGLGLSLQVELLGSVRS